MIFRVGLMLCLFLIVAPIVSGQDTCPALAEQAVQSTRSACTDAGSHQLCYGHSNLTASFANQVTFDEPGALADVSQLQHLDADPLNVETGTWGIGVMRIQANLPVGQEVLLVLLGEATITNNIAPQESRTIEVTATSSVNVRSGPSTSTAVIGGLAANDTVVADGRVEDGSWLRIRLPDGGSGWLFAQLATSANDLNDLPIITDPSAPVQSPLQDFHLRSGADRPCPSIQHNGLLIQTAEDSESAALVINNATVTLAGTAFVQANETLTIQLLEGTAAVTASDSTRNLLPGTQVSVSLDDSGHSIDAPGDLRPYDETVSALPLDLLDRPITPAVPLTDAELESILSCSVTAAGDVNLRAGPGTVYPLRGTLSANTSAGVIGQAVGTDQLLWWQLADQTWVRSDIVTTENNCDAVTTVEPPPVPTPVPGAAAQTVDIYYWLGICSTVGRGIRAGETVGLFVAGGTWPTSAEASRRAVNHSGSITVDGVPLNTFSSWLKWGENDYGVKIQANWVATSGVHTVVGSSTISKTYSCTITVP